ncbi:Ig-like domain-containing protein [Paenibacillus lemnae]|uniref:S-layer protein n=1 Tax=Paenibacillus lemnae TaxID=1330551 RepID=A0A848MDC6_PAELE|nr:Ig-like domain-containing protein [Paenibacillus lemnae]NMO98150.1 S-layer protein [Paenibacillus lemnae]
MSNKSYYSKDKNNINVSIQGGDKKVMKKILSVALSTAMAFSMFASVAFGDDALTNQQKFDVLKEVKVLNGYPDGQAHLDKDLTRAEFAKVVSTLMGLQPVTGQLSFKDKGYTAKNWAVPYIEAVYSAGLMEGKNTTKMIFDYNGKISVQEMAAVLVRALKLDIPSDVNNNASTWAKGYVQAAINEGIVGANVDPKANATRSLMVDTAYAIYLSEQQPKVVDYAVTENGKVVTFKLANNESVKVTLNTALVANTATEVPFEYAGYKYNESVTWVVTTATKVDSASASNLKEVVVKFNGEVDKESAEKVANYSLRSGKVIDSVTLSSDLTTATLLLKDPSVLSNNRTDAVSVSNVKAGNTTINSQNIEFTAIDNALPTVTSVVSLGTKSVKVVFSEPVKTVGQTNFNLDGREFFGRVTTSNNDRTVILTPYSSSALAVGNHTLTVSGVKDYADFVSLASTHEINVVEDTAAPTIAEATATLETVTITFSEDVDVDTVDAAKVYWKSGDNKITAVSKKQLADNKWQFTFGAEKSLPTGPVSIFVEGVKDYSGNTIAANSSVVVTPEIDQTRPEVTAVSAENARQIKITFSKAVNEASAENKANYTVKNKDGNSITVKDVVRDTNDWKVVYVNLYTDLSASGDNTLTIQNVRDNTKLQNTILDYTGKVSLADRTAPEIDSETVNTSDRRLVVKFNEKMDVDSLVNYSNYLVEIDGRTQPLTSSIAEITPFQDGTAVSLKFTESIGNKIVRLASGNGITGYTNINSLTVLAVKDVNGNVLKEFTSNNSKIELDADTTIALNGKAELVDRRTIKVKFNAGIVNYSAGAFTNVSSVDGAPRVSSVEVDGTSTVNVKFENDITTSGSNVDLRVDLDRLITNAGATTTAGTVDVSTADGNLKDSVKPVVNKADTVYPFEVTVATGTPSFAIKFSETLQTNSNVASDLKVIRNTDNKELSIADGEFSATASGDTVTVTLNDGASRSVASEYRVEVKDARLIVDAAGNRAADFNGISELVGGQAAPSGLAAVNDNFAAEDTGEITGLDAAKSYEYKLASAPVSSYELVSGATKISGLPAGTYVVREAAPSGGVPSATTQVTVGQDAPTNVEAVDAAKTALTLSIPTGTEDDAATTITLRSAGDHGTSITWVVNNNVVSGSYTTPDRPAAGDAAKEVTLVANIQKGSVTDQKSFVVTVPETGSDITVAVAP